VNLQRLRAIDNRPYVYFAGKGFFMFIVISILIFGLLIAIHELGHFIAAKAFGVGVPEFAIGMGPKLLKKQGKETLYTLRAIPMGGFCAMDGDDNKVVGEKSLFAKPMWQRIVIFVSGSFLNLVAGFLILIILTGMMTSLPTTTITGFAEGFPLEGEQGFQEGDRFHSIDGARVFQFHNIGVLLDMAPPGGVDVVVVRDGERVTLPNLPLERRVFPGSEAPRYGFDFSPNENPTVGDRLVYTWNAGRDIVRQLPLTIRMFTRGQAGIEDVSSVVGIVDVMNQVGTAAPNVGSAVSALAFLAALISISVAIFNLLPIPGLDGGRIFLMIISWSVMKISGKPLDSKYEGYINTVGLFLLFGFMIFIIFQDIIQIATR